MGPMDLILGLGVGSAALDDSRVLGAGSHTSRRPTRLSCVAINNVWLRFAYHGAPWLLSNAHPI